MRSNAGKRPPVIDQYARVAGQYEARWSSYVDSSTRETLARLDLGPHERLLDVGCGTGALLAALSRTFPQSHLTGVDATPEMLAVARSRLPENVALMEGWAERLPFADGGFDVVVSCNMFHYIRQPGAALAEMVRVLRPGGRLVITDWCDDYLACRVCDLYLRLFDRAHFRVYRRRECRDMLERAGLAGVIVESYRISWLWGLMTARAAKPLHATNADSR